MKITAIETIRQPDRPAYLWLHVHTDEGLVGLGEAQRGIEATDAVLHGPAAAALLGQDPLDVERHNGRLLGGYLGFNASSAETRAAGAVDIALWDLFGQALGQPVSRLLGGSVRSSIPAYNTCAGDGYNRAQDRRVVRPGDPPPPGASVEADDQAWFMHAADDLAGSLLADGFAGMKIWPFDPWALDNGGTYASAAAIRAGLEPFEKVRRAHGTNMELLAELHSLWSVPAASRICAALEPLGPLWAEDPVRRMDDTAAVAAVARATRIPLAGGETLASRPIFRDLLNRDALGTVIIDLGWCGGLSEARRIAVLADSWARPVAPHDCSGPVSFAASVHLAMHAPNAAFQECVRAFLRGWYRDTVTDIPHVADGAVHALPGPGLGTRLLPGFAGRPGAIVRRTTTETLR